MMPNFKGHTVQMHLVLERLQKHQCCIDLVHLALDGTHNTVVQDNEQIIAKQDKEDDGSRCQTKTLRGRVQLVDCERHSECLKKSH